MIELKLGGWCRRIALGTGVGVVGVRVTERPGVAVFVESGKEQRRES